MIVSPIEGAVLSRLVEPGEAIAPGAAVLLVEDTRRLVVKIGVTEREVARLAVGQAVSLTDVAGGENVPATVTSVAPAPGNGGLYAIETTPAKSPSLTPGTMVTALFEGSRGPPTVRVPLEAVMHRDGKAFVAVVGDGRVLLREIAVDGAEGREVAVRDGLQTGERIVREGAQFLADGQVVQVLE